MFPRLFFQGFWRPRANDFSILQMSSQQEERGYQRGFLSTAFCLLLTAQGSSRPLQIKCGLFLIGNRTFQFLCPKQLKSTIKEKGRKSFVFALIWESVISYWFLSVPRIVCFASFCGFFLMILFFFHSSLFRPKFICFKKSIWLLCYGSPHKAAPTVPEATKSYQTEWISKERTAS